MEHGCAFDFFNRADFKNDPAFGRPIGYYISRLAATARDTLDRQEGLGEWLDNLILSRSDYALVFNAIIDALALRAGLNDSSKVVMPVNLPAITLREKS